MWPALLAFGRAYAPMIVFPFAFTIGVIGYNLESFVSDKSTPWKPSVLDRREERHQREAGTGEEFVVPKTMFQSGKDLSAPSK